jgi:hypothetical protein
LANLKEKGETTVKRWLVAFFSLLTVALVNAPARAASISYIISLDPSSGPVLGPATFQFDSSGLTTPFNAPDLAGFELNVDGLIFTQQTPGDDSLDLLPSGLIQDLNVDAEAPANAPDTSQVVQFSPDLTYSFTNGAGADLGTGTYSLATAPEPSSFGLLFIGLAAAGLARFVLHDNLRQASRKSLAQVIS